MSTRKTAESPEQLVENLRALIAEAEKTLGSELAEGAEDKLASLRERFSDAREKMEHAFSVAKEKVVAGAKQTDSAIRSHPYESLAIALGVGVLLGAFLRRNK
ncbi:MAG TPA: hypothetical protein VIO38_11070 [Rariglobus sp.]|jgi:ElaB/YqjD/DUF883 family membrane-anchored ribosome-binding protein